MKRFTIPFLLLAMARVGLSQTKITVTRDIVHCDDVTIRNRCYKAIAAVSYSRNVLAQVTLSGLTRSVSLAYPTSGMDQTIVSKLPWDSRFASDFSQSCSLYKSATRTLDANNELLTGLKVRQDGYEDPAYDPSDPDSPPQFQSGSETIYGTIEAEDTRELLYGPDKILAARSRVYPQELIVVLKQRPSTSLPVDSDVDWAVFNALP